MEGKLGFGKRFFALDGEEESFLTSCIGTSPFAVEDFGSGGGFTCKLRISSLPLLGHVRAVVLLLSRSSEWLIAISAALKRCTVRS